MFGYFQNGRYDKLKIEKVNHCALLTRKYLADYDLFRFNIPSLQY